LSGYYASIWLVSWLQEARNLADLGTDDVRHLWAWFTYRPLMHSRLYCKRRWSL